VAVNFAECGTELPRSCLVGPGATVQTHPSVTAAVDYEGELTVVIGRQGRDISRAQAMSHVWATPLSTT
jgi:2-keto-4-pentenoate hydratase/2-oxohepta-3-ene-1,7-dioic acid hydratase in catechol pathway